MTMADRNEEAVAHLAERLKGRVGKALTYRRGNKSCALTGTVGTSLLRVSDNGGVVHVIRTERDFLFAAADLVLDGEVTEPRDGDLIDEADGNVTRRYKLLPPGQAEPAWRYTDQTRLMIRAHTKGQGVV